MDRDKSKDTKKTSSLLHKLTRRSTKVEPQQNHGDLCGTVSGSSVSAHSSPINQFRQSNLRRHSSTHNISTIDQDILPAHDENCVATKSKYPNNRFSHQFSLCCAIDDRMTTPPVSVRYNSIANVDVKKKSSSHKELPVYATNPCPNGGGVGGITTVVTVHKLPDTEISSDSLPDEEKSPSNFENNNGSLMATPLSIKDKPKPVFNEYQSSIAMSACRSRLRQKLLPPGKSHSDFTGEQHFSSPNISSNEVPGAEVVVAEPPEGNRSLSYDILTGVKRPASADSLAKQSLIAAQLLNLIPAERVRER